MFCLFRVVAILLVLDLTVGVYIDNDETTAFTRFEAVTADKRKFSQYTPDCYDFTNYVMQCTQYADSYYNGSRKSPPLPSKFRDWCSSLKQLTYCAIQWNSACREKTESHFNQESLDGHLYLVESTCDDETFVNAYKNTEKCINNTEEDWRRCYSAFKKEIKVQKNSPREWTHYKTHFNMCCSRRQFRNCTYHMYHHSSNSKHCSENDMWQLQKFSVIASESDVKQDCDSDVDYEKCPGGDPRRNQYIMRMRKKSSSSTAFHSVSVAVMSFVLNFYSLVELNDV